VFFLVAGQRKQTQPELAAEKLSSDQLPVDKFCDEVCDQRQVELPPLNLLNERALQQVREEAPGW
jgi:hypothetical protein